MEYHPARRVVVGHTDGDLGIAWDASNNTGSDVGLFRTSPVGDRVETAIVTNFLLNEFWTFSDFSKKQPGMIRRMSRLLKFNLFCAGGAVINLAILWTLTEFAGLHYLLSNLFGIGTATLWNYGMNANITWESTRAERKNNAAYE